MTRLAVRAQLGGWVMSAFLLACAIVLSPSLTAEEVQLDSGSEASSPEGRYSFLRDHAADSVAKIQKCLESIEFARDSVVRDPAVADSLASMDRIALIAAVRRHLKSLRNAEVVVFDGEGTPFARVLVDGGGHIRLESSGASVLASQHCRKAYLLDVYAIHGQPWTAIMNACEDESVRLSADRVLVSVAAVRDRRSVTIGAIEIVERLTRVDAVLASVSRELPATCTLSILNWDGMLLNAISEDPTAATLRPPLDSLTALATVSFDAKLGLYVNGEKLGMFVLPIPAMSQEGRWVTSVLLCAAPKAGEHRPVAPEERRNGNFAWNSPVALLLASICVIGVAIWYITRRRLLRAADTAHQALEEAVRERNRLISGVSHDIRGPLGAIMGFAALIRNDSAYMQEGPLRSNAFDAIKQSCSFILRLTDHLLDLRSATMGRFAIEARCTDVLMICNECVNLYSIEAHEKGVTISFSHPNLEQLRLLSDPTRVRQIVQNLVGNAVRYTERGSVVLSVWIPDPTRNEIEISVADTGIGISEDAKAKIFAPFYQEKRAESSSRSGTGLGLAVVKTIVTALGGSIDVRSEEGKGSVFVVRIPATPWVETDESIAVHSSEDATQTTEQAGEPNLPLAGMSIAFADDYAQAREITSHVLRGGGAVVHVFDSGDDLVQAVLCGLQVDCILLDLQMPGMSGNAAAEALQRSGFAGPIVALSAIADEQARLRSRASGFSEHLSKPIDAVDLRRVIASLVAGHRGAPQV